MCFIDVLCRCPTLKALNHYIYYYFPQSIELLNLLSILAYWLQNVTIYFRILWGYMTDYRQISTPCTV